MSIAKRASCFGRLVRSRTSPLNLRGERGARLRAGRKAFMEVDKDGYLRGAISRRHYLAHRVVWAMHTGGWPPHMIDHINGKPDDNRIENLRLATNSQNQQNKRYCGKASGFKGVYVTGPRFTDAKRYQAMIMVNRRAIFLGLHPTAELAHAAYAAAARKYFGDFARVA